MALAGAVDAVGPVQAGVEPLRRVRRHHLARQHEAQLVVEGVRVVLGGEVAALPAPIGPGAGEPVEHLLGGDLGTGALILGQGGQRLLVGDGTPQEGRNVVLLDLLQTRRDAGLAEVFLRQHVRRDLGEGGRHLDVVEREDDRAVGIPDLRFGRAELDAVVGCARRLGVMAIDLHRAALRSRCLAGLWHPAAAAGPPELRAKIRVQLWISTS